MYEMLPRHSKEFMLRRHCKEYDSMTGALEHKRKYTRDAVQFGPAAAKADAGPSECSTYV